jgi:hypothetical protein
MTDQETLRTHSTHAGTTIKISTVNNQDVTNSLIAMIVSYVSSSINTLASDFCPAVPSLDAEAKAAANQRTTSKAPYFSSSCQRLVLQLHRTQNTSLIEAVIRHWPDNLPNPLFEPLNASHRAWQLLNLVLGTTL